MNEETRNPDMNDCFLAGIPLREAVALERAIEAEPDRPASHWWKVLRAFQKSSQGPPQSAQGSC
jgi:hypothetical protein